jgi:hydroxypyruvate isomerase
MLFRNLPIIERIKRISALGFHVEIWDWTKHDIAALAAIAATFFLDDRLPDRYSR